MKVLIYLYSIREYKTISMLDYYQLICSGYESSFWVVPMLDTSYYNPLTQENLQRITMKARARSNCLFGAIAIKLKLGGKLEWRPGWHRDGWRGFLNNPWGHFRVRLGNTLWSYSAFDKNISVWNQLWFQGYAKKQEVISESR